jgi:RHS repeat-associated protein
VAFNLRYPGQYFDKESGLHYNGFRTYSAEPGRYTQPDPIGLDGGWNRFAYVDNNPLRFADPLGLWSVDVGIFLGSGVNFSFGRDEGSGRLFFSTQLGKGVGGGVMYAPHGGLPSGMDKLLDCGNEQVFAGAFGKVGVSALGASLDIASADVGVSLPSTRPYTGQSWLDYSLGKKWGLKAEVSGGVQFTTISAARFPASCGCR